jgi:hypothetical protein
LLSVEIFEFPSRTAAHDHVIDVLAQFQSPDISRDHAGELGDVAFITPQRTTVLYARANLVVLARNAGPDVAPVFDAAAGLDRLISRRPRPRGKVMPEIRSLRIGTGGPLPVGAPAPLNVQAADPLDRPVWFTFWSGRGEVRLQPDGVPAYQSASAGTDALTVYAVNENGGVASESVEITVTAE